MVCKYESIELCCSKRTKNHHELKKLPVKFKHQTSLCRGFRSPSKASVNPSAKHTGFTQAYKSNRFLCCGVKPI